MKRVLEMIAKNETDQERRVYNCIYRCRQEWIPLGSGKEVEDNQPKHARPLVSICICIYFTFHRSITRSKTAWI